MTYYRFYGEDGPMSNWGHAMFSDDPVTNSQYGPVEYHYDGTDGVDIETIQAQIAELWDIDNDAYITPIEYRHLTGQEVAEAANPVDIVDSANIYDCEVVGWLWDRILEPNGINAVITNDGAIVFDETLITRLEEKVWY